MSERLTKARIREGIDRREDVPLPERDGHVVIRPLTAGEASEVAELASQGVRSQGSAIAIPTVQVDVALATRGQHAAKFKAVAYAMSCDDEKWSPSEVRANFDADEIETIFEAVDELCGGDLIDDSVLNEGGEGESPEQFRGD